MIRRLVGSVAALLLATTVTVSTVQPATAAKPVSADQKAAAAVVGKYFDAVFYPDEAATNTLLAAKDAATQQQYQAAYPGIATVLDKPDAPWATIKPYYAAAASLSSSFAEGLGSPTVPLDMHVRANAAQVIVIGSKAAVYADAMVMSMLGERLPSAWSKDDAGLAFVFVKTSAGWKIDTAASLVAATSTDRPGVITVQKTVVTTSDVALFAAYPSKQKLGTIPAGTKVTVFHTYGSGSGFVGAAKVSVGKKTVKKVYGFATVAALTTTQRTTVKGWPTKAVAHGSAPAVVTVTTNRPKAVVAVQTKRGARWVTVKKVRTASSGKATVTLPKKAGRYRLVVKKAKGFTAATSGTLTLTVKK